MENIGQLEDEEFTQENLDQITPVKDITHQKMKNLHNQIMWEAHLKTKTLQILKIMGVKED